MAERSEAEAERFENELVAQQLRRVRLVRSIGAAACLVGAVLSGVAGLLLLRQTEHAIVISFAALGVALVGGGVTLLIKSLRSGTSASSVDEFLSRAAPRILGGKRPEQLDRHRRRRRPRRKK